MDNAIDTEILMVGEFRNLIHSKCDEEWSDLHDFAGEEDEGIESYAEEAWLIEEVRQLGKCLALVALHRVVEHNIRRVLRQYWSEEAIRQHRLFQTDRLKKFLKDERGVQLSTVAGFAEINQLRKLSNVVKHDFGTDPEKLKDIDATYASATFAIPLFLSDLKGKLAT